MGPVKRNPAVKAGRQHIQPRGSTVHQKPSMVKQARPWTAKTPVKSGMRVKRYSKEF
jgi:hypothetical protein